MDLDVIVISGISAGDKTIELLSSRPFMCMHGELYDYYPSHRLACYLLITCHSTGKEWASVDKGTGGRMRKF